MSQLLKHLKVLYWWAAVVALHLGNLCCDASLLLVDFSLQHGRQDRTSCCFFPPRFWNCLLQYISPLLS